MLGYFTNLFLEKTCNAFPMLVFEIMKNYCILVPPRELRIEQNHAAEEGELYTLTCIADHVKPVPRLWWELRSKYLHLMHLYFFMPFARLVDKNAFCLFSR